MRRALAVRLARHPATAPRPPPPAPPQILRFCTYHGPAPSSLLPARAQRYSAQTMEQLHTLFNEYDEDGGGTIDRAELHSGLADVFKAIFPVDTRAISPGSVARQRAHQETFISEISASVEGVEELTFEDFTRLMGPYLTG